MKLCWAVEQVRGGRWKRTVRMPTKALADTTARSLERKWGSTTRVKNVCKR
jgi:hypothetical protein